VLTKVFTGEGVDTAVRHPSMGVLGRTALYVALVMALLVLMNPYALTTWGGCTCTPATLGVSGISTTSHEVTTAVLVEVTPPWDTIDDGVKECILNALKYAEDHNYALILSIDSYGGLLEAAFSIGDAFARAKVPVIAYVSGGKALSAATMIILPANIIALSPNSIIGAMQPIMYNPTTGTITFINESKIINPVVAKAVSYAKLRNRNTTAAKLFVVKSLVLTADQAVKYHVANLIANSLNDLLKKINGVHVNTSTGTYVLRITNVEKYSCSLRARVLSTLENPMVSSVLMTIGILGTIFAILSGKLPILPLALLFLLLGLIGSGFNPNVISILLLIIGGIMLAIELFVTPGFGVMGITGIILIAVGIALAPANIPSGFSPPAAYARDLQITAAVIGGGLGALTGFILYKVIQAKRSKPQRFDPVGKVGKAVDSIEPGGKGFVVVDGEYWLATSDVRVDKGSEVIVTGMEGHVLRVRPRGTDGSS